MTTSNTQSKWLLIGVRVCAVYLALWAVTSIAAVFIISIESAFDWPKLLFIPFAILFGLLAFRLWQLRPWSRELTADIFIGHIILSVMLLISQSGWFLPRVLVSCVLAITGIIGWIFLTRPAVKALFENQKSEINNQKSENA